MTPTVSVIMAAYNGADLLPATIASLQAQTLTEFEVIIVDDCSTDHTRDVLRAIDDPRFRIIESTINQGPVCARNMAVDHARGRYLAGLDQDDLCRPTRFARQVAYLDAHPDTTVLGTGAAFLDGDIESPAGRTTHSTPALIEWLLLIENPLIWSSVMLRADAVSHPFTDPDRRYAEDFDLYHHMAAKGRIARLDDDLVIYRRHEGGASQRYTEMMQASAAMVLTDAYRPLFCDDAQEAAWLMIHYMMAQAPVPDRQTLLKLGEVLARLQADFLKRSVVSQDDQKLIRWETARRWGHVGRSALRTGTIGLADAIAARPDHLGLGHTGFDDLVMSRLIGSARAVRRRYQD